MGIKIGFLGDTGSRVSDLMVWAAVGLGITLAINSSRKLLVDCCNRKVGAFTQEKDNWIDQLPDDILCNIVSRLKATEASRTSILSRRWRNIWTLNPLMVFSCLPTLDIWKNYHDHVVYDDKQRFLKAVNQCLRLYSGQKLKTISMHCCFLNDYTCHLVRWMQIIAKLEVEELYLGHPCPSSHGEKAFTFSFKLIDGLSKLRTLDLRFCYVETSFVSQCNSLVNLTLRGVPLHRQGLSDILVSFSNLEMLDLEYCELPENLRITGPNLKLKNLKMNDCYDVKKLEISELINLETIKIKMCTEVEISLSSVPKLSRLMLITPEMHNSFGDCQTNLPQLECLVIQATHQILGLPPTFQMFSNVRMLCLMTSGDPYREIREEVDLWNFASVLSAFPFLERFHLMVGGPLCEDVRNVAEWPVLRHKHLKHMELAGFSHSQNELEFAKFILTSSEVLCLFELQLRTRSYDGENFYLTGKKYVGKNAYVEVVCAMLQEHALSKHAIVEFC